MLSDPIAIVARLVRVFDDLGIPYLVGGSLASSLYGIPRTTQDVDLVAGVGLPQVDAFTQAISGEFYTDAGMIREAVKRGASFNVIHLATMFKADVFVLRSDPWAREEMARARVTRVESPDGMVEIRFSSPEDTILHKLRWFRMGNEVSDRQWNDIVGVLKIQGDTLDKDYLDRWATSLGVADLMARARSQAQ